MSQAAVVVISALVVLAARAGVYALHRAIGRSTISLRGTSAIEVELGANCPANCWCDG